MEKPSISASAPKDDFLGWIRVARQVMSGGRVAGDGVRFGSRACCSRIETLAMFGWLMRPMALLFKPEEDTGGGWWERDAAGDTVVDRSLGDVHPNGWVEDPGLLQNKAGGC